jgi:Na+/H+ antiporter NhaD/arsenite permease-like protein
MYNLTTYPTDHNFWEFLALTSGTGGSMIIIGSAAGVAVMGIENISFGWFLKRISLLALAGFIAGVLVYIGLQSIL